MLLKNFWMSAMGFLFFEADNGAGSGGGNTGDDSKASGGSQGGAAGDPKPKPDKRDEKREADRPKNPANEEARRFRQERNEMRTALEQVQGQLSTISGELKAERDARLAAEARALKSAQSAAAIKFGLPASMAERLKGTTEEEIFADAEALAKDLPKGANGQTQAAASVGNPASTEKLTLEAIKKMTPEQITANWDKVQAVLAQKH